MNASIAHFASDSTSSSDSALLAEPFARAAMGRGRTNAGGRAAVLLSALAHAGLLLTAAFHRQEAPARAPASAVALVDVSLDAAEEAVVPEPPPAPVDPPEQTLHAAARAPAVAAAAPHVTPEPSDAPPSSNPYDSPDLVVSGETQHAGFLVGEGTTIGPAVAQTATKPGPVAGTPNPTPAAAKPVAHVDLSALARSWHAQVSALVRQRAGRDYPRSARRLGREGTVHVGLVVAASGAVTSVQIQRSSGHDDLDRAAIAAVRAVGVLPPPPRELGWSSKPFSVPIAYRLE
jgi:protein TonB